MCKSRGPSSVRHSFQTPTLNFHDRQNLFVWLVIIHAMFLDIFSMYVCSGDQDVGEEFWKKWLQCCPTFITIFFICLIDGMTIPGRNGLVVNIHLEIYFQLLLPLFWTTYLVFALLKYSGKGTEFCPCGSVVRRTVDSNGLEADLCRLIITVEQIWWEAALTSCLLLLNY